MNIVSIKIDDIDKHDLGCKCGLCHYETNKSYGAGVFEVPIELVDKIKEFCKTNEGGADWREYFEYELDDLEVYERVYGCSDEVAYNNALLICEENGFAQLSDIVEKH